MFTSKSQTVCSTYLLYNYLEKKASGAGNLPLAPPENTDKETSEFTNPFEGFLRQTTSLTSFREQTFTFISEKQTTYKINSVVRKVELPTNLYEH